MELNLNSKHFSYSSTHTSQVLLCSTSTQHDCPEQSIHPTYDTAKKRVRMFLAYVGPSYMIHYRFIIGLGFIL